MAQLIMRTVRGVNNKLKKLRPVSAWIRLTIGAVDMFARNILSLIAIEVGTSKTSVYQNRVGEIFSAPTLIAFKSGLSKNSRNAIAIGEEAKALIGRVPPSVEVVRPLVNGNIADTQAAITYIKSVLSTAVPGFWIAKPRIICAVPSASTPVTRKAFAEIFRYLGCSDVSIVPQHLAALVGSGIDFSKRGGTLIVNMGAGSTDVAITSFGTTVANTSINLGGDEMNRSIQSYLRNVRDLEIGDATVENLKLDFGCALYSDNYGNMTTTTPAKCLATRRAIVAHISKNDIAKAVKPLLDRITDRVFDAFERVSPDIGADVLNGSAFLSGGVARMESIQEYFTENTAVLFQRVDGDEIVSSGLLSIISSPRKFATYLR